MYHFLDQQIQTLGIEQKWIRHELQGEVHEPKKLPDYPADIPVPDTVEITVTICDEKKNIKASTNDTLLLFNSCDYSLNSTACFLFQIGKRFL